MADNTRSVREDVDSFKASMETRFLDMGTSLEASFMDIGASLKNSLDEMFCNRETHTSPGIGTQSRPYSCNT